MSSSLALACIIFLKAASVALGFAQPQQPFGPSPQSMYRNNPGSAPTYVTYVPSGGIPEPVVRPDGQPETAKPRTRTAAAVPSHASARRRVAHRRATR